MLINSVLLIDSSYYASEQEDMEYLYRSGNVKNLIKAAEKCEKFHSYFHYEESFFNTILSNLLDQREKKIQYLEKAIKLSPVNKHAFMILNVILGNSDLNRKRELELKISSMKSLSENLFHPHETFLEYMKFATENNMLEEISSPDFSSFWGLYEEYKKNNDISTLESAMNDLEKRHILYHKEAAEIYHAIYMIACNNNDEFLGRFSITKAKNLDPSITVN